MAGKFRVDGLKELEKALGELPKATAKAAMRRALMTAGEPMARAARNNAPRGDTDRLHESIEVSTRSVAGEAGKKAFHEVMKAGGTKAEARGALIAANKANSGGYVEVSIGPTGGVFHGLFQEFGTRHHQAQPFLRPAFDAGTQDVMKRLKVDLADEINKAAERAARKAARAKLK